MKKYTHEEIQAKKPSIEEAKIKAKSEIYVVLDNVRSLYNVGAFFRTCEGAGIKKILLCGITASPPRKEISKTALGADEIVEYEYFDDTEEAIEWLHERNIRVVAVELAKNAKLYSDFDYTFPCALVFGHEVYGVSDEVMELVDDAVYLPMLGRANSLNVSVCGGIAIYDALRKYNG